MKEILKQVKEWLQEAQDDYEDSGSANEQLINTGRIEAYTQVRVLLQQAGLQQDDSADLFLPCPKCGKPVDIEIDENRNVHSLHR